MAEPMKNRIILAYFTYADEIKIRGTGRIVTDSAAAAQQEVNSLLE